MRSYALLKLFAVNAAAVFGFEKVKKIMYAG
jgi:hypothetical protein